MKPGTLVTVVRDCASLRTDRGDVITWDIPTDSIGIILDATIKNGSIKVAWNFDAIGWVLVDNLSART